MSEKIENQAVELSDEESEKAIGGVGGNITMAVYCPHCNVTEDYSFDLDATSIICRHCGRNIGC